MRHSPSLPPLAITSLLAAFQAAVSLTTLYQVHHLIHGILAAIIAVGSRKIRSKLVSEYYSGNTKYAHRSEQIYKWFVPGKL
jgi:hypothetical protein